MNSEECKDWSRGLRGPTEKARGCAGKGKTVQRENGAKEKPPWSVSAQGGVNPAAPYSPGPGGQVPSAKGGLTAVFGMGTGVTLPRGPLKQSVGRPAHSLCGGGENLEEAMTPFRSINGSGLLTQRELYR